MASMTGTDVVTYSRERRVPSVYQLTEGTQSGTNKGLASMGNETPRACYRLFRTDGARSAGRRNE
jgi:hypothetical protein